MGPTCHDNPHHLTVLNLAGTTTQTGACPPDRPPRAEPGDRGHATGAPARPAAPRTGYFLFLRWIRVFFSSLRCFFFAIRLRRFLMTEPIRPPSLRHTGRRARHHSPAAGRLGTRPKLEGSVNANRTRSPQAYLLPHGGGTASHSRGRLPPGGGTYQQCPGRLVCLRFPQRTPSRPLRKHGHGQRTRFRGCRTPTLRCPASAKTPVVAQARLWCCGRFRSPALSSHYALRRCRRRPPAGTG